MTLADDQMRTRLDAAVRTEPCRPLDAAVRVAYERAFGVDLSDVRLYVGEWPARLGTAAFAYGPAVFLDPAVARHSSPGRDVLGHELVHILQQRSGAVPADRLVVVDPGLEAEADRLADLARAGGRDLYPARGRSSAVPVVQPVPPITYVSQQITVAGLTATVPVSATATLTSANMGGGTGADGSLRPPGFVTGGCPNHHQRGHLVGNNLGGPGNDLRNLVTLIDGTNHPIMYEYELMVRQHVLANPGVSFTYRVVANYNAARYSVAPVAPGGAATGAASNPYCPFPCPESVEIHFTDANGAYPITVLQTVTESGMDWTGTFVTHSYTVQVAGPVGFTNGVYKFHYGSAKHVALGCFSAT